MGPRSLRSLPRAHTAFCVPIPGALGRRWASPQLGSWIRPRPARWSLCKGCPGGSLGGQVGTDRAPPDPHLQAVTPKSRINSFLSSCLSSAPPTACQCLCLGLRLLGPPTPDHSVINCRLHRCRQRLTCLTPLSQPGRGVSGSPAFAEGWLSRVGPKPHTDTISRTQGLDGGLL